MDNFKYCLEIKEIEGSVMATLLTLLPKYSMEQWYYLHIETSGWVEPNAFEDSWFDEITIIEFEGATEWGGRTYPYKKYSYEFLNREAAIKYSKRINQFIWGAFVLLDRKLESNEIEEKFMGERGDTDFDNSFGAILEIDPFDGLCIELYSSDKCLMKNMYSILREKPYNFIVSSRGEDFNAE